MTADQSTGTQTCKETSEVLESGEFRQRIPTESLFWGVTREGPSEEGAGGTEGLPSRAPGRIWGVGWSGLRVGSMVLSSQ